MTLKHHIPSGVRWAHADGHLYFDLGRSGHQLEDPEAEIVLETLEGFARGDADEDELPVEELVEIGLLAPGPGPGPVEVPAGLRFAAHDVDPGFWAAVDEGVARGDLGLCAFTIPEGVVVGPRFRPEGPCPRCAALRYLGRAHWSALDLFVAAQRPGARAGAAFPRAPAAVVEWAAARLSEAPPEEGRVGRVLLVRPSGEVTAHPVLKHPFCRACAPPREAPPLEEGERAASARWREILDDDPESLPPVPAVHERLTDPVFGPFFHDEEWKNRARYFRNYPIIWGGIAMAREGEWVSTGHQGINGTGPSLDHRRLIATSEGTERYAQYAALPDVTNKSFDELGERAFPPERLVLYSEAQYETPGFPRPRLDRGAKRDWSWGTRLDNLESRLFPLELIRVWTTDESYPQRLVDQNLTSGTASHVNYRRALLNAIRELIERDAYMMTWYKRVELPEVVLPERVGDTYIDELLAFIEAADLELRVRDLRLDFPIPTFLLLGRPRRAAGSWEAGGTALVAVANLDPIAALARGLCEMALHWETLAVTPEPSKDWRNNLYNPDNIEEGWRTWWPTYMHYLNPANHAPLDFLWSTPSARTELSQMEGFETGDPATDLDRLVQMAVERDLAPWVFDLVDHDVRLTPFKVAKVLMPGLLQLTPGHQSRRLNFDRLEKIAAACGHPALGAGEVNPDPHPNA